MGHLLQMCQIGDVEEVRAALVNGDVNETDENGSSCLMWAVCNQHEEVVTLLLGVPSVQINAKRPKTQDSRSEWTALHYACLRDGIEVLRKLLDHPGLDVISRLVCSENITLGNAVLFVSGIHMALALYVSLWKKDTQLVCGNWQEGRRLTCME